MYERNKSSKVSDGDVVKKYSYVGNLIIKLLILLIDYFCSIRKKSIGDSDLVSLEDLEKNIMKRKALIFNIEQTLPKENGMYLKIILGNVNVSILNKNDK